MDVIDPILSIASAIYALVEKVKGNKKRSQRVCDRVKALDNLVKSIKKGKQRKITDDVGKALNGLLRTMENAQVLIEKYTQATWVKLFLKAGSHEEEFNNVNDRLNDAFQVLSGALQVEQSDVLYQVFKLSSRQKEEDRKEDDAELQKLILQYMEEQQKKTDDMQKEMEIMNTNVKKVFNILTKPSVTYEDIRIIKPRDLNYKQPKKPFMTTATSEVYKGEYHGFTVAIKRYTDPLNTSPSELRKFFKKEVETMKRFESPNILRMFGICVQDEDGPKPQFFIIMEYCEKGSLLQVLVSEGSSLSWHTKARMCLDAARGLYRLHQTEEKSKVHGCINSNKFLVAKDYTVKLGGFELAKTETSLRKTTKDTVIRSLCYTSPEMLHDINHIYSKESEIYSFGIVLWEVASCSKPFEGLSNKDIGEKVCEEKFKEELPNRADCPKGLADVIDECRAYDGFQRPSAGEVMDKLQNVVAQLEML